MDAFIPGTPEDNLLCFNAVLDRKGRLLVPAYIRKKQGIAKNTLVSVIIDPVRTIKKFKIESESDIQKKLDSLDNVLAYTYDGEYLKISIGTGGSSK